MDERSTIMTDSKKEATMKKLIRFVFCCMAVACGVFLLIHRRAIIARITGGEMPEVPEWHKNHCKCAAEPAPTTEETSGGGEHV